MNAKRYGAHLFATAALSLTLASPEAFPRGGSVSGARGSASWGGGSGSASGRYGGSASWQAGSGGSATTARGGSAAWGGGSGSAHGAYSGSASWNYGSGTATGANGRSASWNHNTAYGYRPPAHTTVVRPTAVRYPAPAYYGHPYNATNGEVAAAAVTGLAVGAMAGSSAANKQQSSSSAQPTSITSPLPIGSQLSSLPAGCSNAVVKSVEYYSCGPNWFKPMFGNSGVYYQVVPQPS